MTDVYEYDEIIVEVPYEFVIDQHNAYREVESGVIRFEPPPIKLKPFPLTLGGHDLGQWVCDGIDVRVCRGGTRYLARLRRLD